MRCVTGWGGDGGERGGNASLYMGRAGLGEQGLGFWVTTHVHVPNVSETTGHIPGRDMLWLVGWRAGGRVGSRNSRWTIE